MLLSCNFSPRQGRSQPVRPARQGTISNAMDYQRARGALRQRRFDRGMDANELADKAGVERTTVYRVEALKKNPGYKPDFDTLEKLVGALGWSLTEFFAQVEGADLQTEPLSDRTAPPAPSLGHDLSLPRPLDDTGALLAGLARAIARLTDSVDHLAGSVPVTTGQPPTSARHHAPGRTPRRRKTG